MAGYTTYLITPESREQLLSAFPPKYPKVFAEHITDRFPAESDQPILEAQSVKVIGYADSEDGLECLVVEVNHNSRRSDGSLYHITLSLNPYSPVAQDIAEKALLPDSKVKRVAIAPGICLFGG